MAKKYTGRSKKSYRRGRRNRVMRPQRILPTGFPQTTMVKLKYVDTITLDSALGVVDSRYFRCNSLFDPDQAAGGHQPLGHDQWSSFYNHYVVVGALCKATFAKDSNTPEGGFNVCGIQVTDDTVASANVTTLLEQGMTSKKYAYKSINSHKPVTVTRGFSTKKFFNVTNVSDNIDRLGALITANPIEQAFFQVFTGAASSAVNPNAQTCLVEITYTVIYSEPKELPQS